MRRPLRLTVCLLLGAGCGFVFLSPLLLSHYWGYDHGFGEGQRCDLAGSVLGAIAGLGVEIVRRYAEQGPRQFSVRELLGAVTFTAVTLGVTIALLRWVDTPYSR